MTSTLHRLEEIIKRFPNRYEVFAVSEQTFRELQDVGLPADADLTECGFKSVVFNGVPVVQNEGCANGNIIAIEKDSVETLARKD